MHKHGFAAAIPFGRRHMTFRHTSNLSGTGAAPDSCVLCRRPPPRPPRHPQTHTPSTSAQSEYLLVSCSSSLQPLSSWQWSGGGAHSAPHLEAFQRQQLSTQVLRKFSEHVGPQRQKRRTNPAHTVAIRASVTLRSLISDFADIPGWLRCICCSCFFLITA